MSDVMLYGILGMPYEIAMNDELSRFQFYKTVQRLLEKDSQQQEEIESLKKQLDTRTRELIGASFYEHDYKTLMAKPPLTDAEILEICDLGEWHRDEFAISFARAILRKALEK